MKKHKGYQKYLIGIRESGIKPFFRKITQNNDFLNRMYMRLTNISVKKLKEIPNITTATKVLDIGCGTGEALIYIKKYLNSGIQCFGVDLDKNPVLPSNIKFDRCDVDLTPLPYEDRYFDVVMSNFVIEHLKNPQNLFLEAFRILKPGGYFYCSTEYYTSLFCVDYWNFYSDPTHVRPWTKRSLKTLSQISGFSIYKIGIIRWWEFLPLLPFVPILNLLTKSNFSFIPYEIIGRTVYAIVKKL